MTKLEKVAKEIDKSAERLAKMMIKDEKFMAAWRERCDQEDFKYLLSQVWGKKKIIAAYYFGIFIIGDFINERWVVTLLSPDCQTQKMSPAGTKDFMYPLEDWAELIYEDWKKMDEEGHTGRNLDLDSKYFAEPENSEKILDDVRISA